MTFEALFADDIRQLDEALTENTLEQNHLRRCMELAHLVDWQHGNADNELGQLLGTTSTAQFDEILKRISGATEHLSAPQLQNPRQFLIHAMFVHDLGKYDATLGRFNGTGHEERSAEIVERQRQALCTQLGWSEQSAELLIGLTRFHSILGIIHLGGASMIYLTPLLTWLLPLEEDLQRFFLDLLIVLNCCDAGASGNFETNQFYLNDDRLTTYIQATDELMLAAREVRQREHADPQAVLLQQATQLPNLVKRVQRIVASGNALSATTEVVTHSVQKAIEGGLLRATGFALTRFDHGTYVFEPLLHRLSHGSNRVQPETLDKLLRLIGYLSLDTNVVTIIYFRDTFSMKPDLRPQNQERFELLLQAVHSGQIETVSSMPRRVEIQ